MTGAHDQLESRWPLFGLRIRIADLTLRHVREADLVHLAAIHPDDHEHDPSVTPLPGHSLDQHRERLVHQGYWRSVGNWSPMSWCLDFLVERDGEVIGLQSLQAEDFPSLRTVDSGSWLIPEARGQGLGIAMRQAVLALAFDQLAAVAAVSSAATSNAASLGVSRHLGYRDNGVGLTRSAAGVTELQHVRLSAVDWRESGLGDAVDVAGVEPCLPWFGT